MRLAVNLLNDTPKGHTWIQVALDLSAGDFELGHVRSMHRDLCRHLQMEPSALRLIGVSRWKPVLDLQLPEPAAHALVEAFEASPDFLPRAFTSPPIESIRLDRLSAERFSIATTETDPWTTLFGSTSEEDLRRLAAAIWKAVRGGLKIALIMIAALVAFLLSSVYTLVTAIFGRLGRSADRAGLPLPKATLSRLPDQLAGATQAGLDSAKPRLQRFALKLRIWTQRCAYRLVEITTLAARSQVDGTQRLEEEIWSQPAKFSLSRISSLTPKAKDFRAVAVPLLETTIAASLVVSIWLMGLIVELFWSLFSQLRESFHKEREKWEETGFRPQDQPWFKDENDQLFIGILGLVGLAVFMGFWLI